MMTVMRAMSGSAFDMRLATLPGRRGDNALVESCAREGVALHEFRMSYAFDAGVLGQLRRYAAQNGIGLVHTHGYRGTLLARLAGLGVPVINTCHGEILEASLRLRGWQWAELRAMRRHRLTIACSDFVRGWLESRGLRREKIRVIHNCYEPPDWAVGQLRQIGQLGRLSFGAGDELVVLYAGRLCEGKGLEFLIEAVSGMEGVALVVAGEGPLRGELEGRAARLGARARFPGHVAEPARLYESADAVVLPSRMEALPMVLIEAAAHGLPSVATRVGGVPEVVEHGRSGLLVSYGDAAGLRGALERMKDAGLREQMGRRAREVWAERFMYERFAGELAAAYSESLEG